MHFNTFWHGTKIPLHVTVCMASFIKNGHQLTVYSYDKLDLPCGIVSMDARDILPKEMLFYYKRPDGSQGSPAGFANLFRYTMLTRHGGWWVDTDVLCTGHPIEEPEIFVGSEGDGYVNNAILRFPKGHSFVETLAQRALEAGANVAQGDTGPKLITKLVKEQSFAGVIDQSIAYPIGYHDFLLPTRRHARVEVEARVAKAPFLHLWNEMFCVNGSGCINAPERGSYLDRQFRRYLPLLVYVATCRWRVRAFQDESC